MNLFINKQFACMNINDKIQYNYQNYWEFWELNYVNFWRWLSKSLQNCWNSYKGKEDSIE